MGKVKEFLKEYFSNFWEILKIIFAVIVVLTILVGICVSGALIWVGLAKWLGDIWGSVVMVAVVLLGITTYVTIDNRR